MVHSVSLIDYLESILPLASGDDEIQIKGLLNDIKLAKEEGFDVVEYIIPQTSYELAFRFSEPDLVKVIYSMSNDGYQTNHYSWVEHQHAYVLQRYAGVWDVHSHWIYQDYFTRKYYVVDGVSGDPSYLGHYSFELPVLYGRKGAVVKQTLEATE